MRAAAALLSPAALRYDRPNGETPRRQMPDFLRPAELGLAPGEIAFCLAVVLAGGFMRGFTGFGFAIAAVPLLALVIAPARAVPFVILLQLFAGFWDWREARRHAHWRSLLWLMAGAIVGAPLGTLSLAVLSPDWARLVIAGAVLLAVVLLSRGFRFARMPGRPALTGTGLAAGVLTGIAAMPGPPVIVLYLASTLAIEVGRASLLIFFAVSNTVGAMSAGAAGLIPSATLVLAAIALPPLLVTQWLGRRVFLRASAGRYRQVALLFLAMLAALTAARALYALLAA
jgi:uncharacterized membrane protein YfcA